MAFGHLMGHYTNSIFSNILTKAFGFHLCADHVPGSTEHHHQRGETIPQDPAEGRTGLVARAGENKPWVSIEREIGPYALCRGDQACLASVSQLLVHSHWFTVWPADFLPKSVASQRHSYNPTSVPKTAHIFV